MSLNKFTDYLWQENSAANFCRKKIKARRPENPLWVTDDAGEHLLYRQRDDDAGAVFEAGFNADVAAMGFDDPTDDGQA